MSASLRKSLQTIEDYKTANPHYTEILDIMADILILREEYCNQMESPIFSVDENLIPQKMHGGLPLLDLTDKKYDLTRPQKYFDSLISITEKRMPEASQNIKDIIQNATFEWEKIIRASFDRKTDDAAAQETKENRDGEENIDLIDLFLEESLRPELEFIAKKYEEKVAKSGWTEGYCPICGKEPKIGEIRREEDGKRYLFCHQCGCKWYFNRIKCPFCGNDEQHSLAYFEVEGDERYRVDVCNKCRRYIKTVELPKSSEEPNMDVEDIATLHLDMIAYDEGYN
ncbi:MAG: formate dehydrogenase accessory protein FdhE [Smithella sp.]|nr:formate dehydrogenase accessory protein FdhE [Smithella sp.]